MLRLRSHSVPVARYELAVVLHRLNPNHRLAFVELSLRRDFRLRRSSNEHDKS
jgi:hypothetical protein